jgi:sensor histidine kinase YesM
VDRSRAYLEILKIRMGERLRFEIDVPADLRATPLPPLMLQTLVENAIKHGLEPKSGGGTLWVRAVREGGSVKITVADDGVGFQEGTAGTGVGLALAFGEQASLALSVNYPSGVAAVLKVPA